MPTITIGIELHNWKGQLGFASSMSIKFQTENSTTSQKSSEIWAVLNSVSIGIVIELESENVYYKSKSTNL